MNDFVRALSEISTLCERTKDGRRARSFALSATNLRNFASDLTSKMDAPMKTSADFKTVAGLDEVTWKMLDELVNTETCERLGGLLKAEPRRLLITAAQLGDIKCVRGLVETKWITDFDKTVDEIVKRQRFF